jgi:enterochelin esterase-like enzyme
MEVPLIVYLPPCYQNSTGAYPVLYLLHGYPYDQSHWVDLGVIDASDRAIREGMEPFIMVLPLQPEPLFRQTDGGQGSYESEFIGGLLPFIDGRYRTVRSPAGRYLGGISRGGIWALEIGLRNPGLFDHIAAYSPSLSVNYARPEFDPLVIASKAERLPSNVLLVAGEDDWALPKTKTLHEALSNRGDLVVAILEVVPGDHSNPTWKSALEHLFGFYALVSGE